MPNGIEVLLEYLNKYKNIEINNENSKILLKEIDKIVKLIEDRRYLTDYDFLEKLVEKYESSDLDTIKYDVFLNVNRYNVYLMNKKIKVVDPILDKNIEFDEVTISTTDILNNLEIDINEIDKGLLNDLNKFIDGKSKNKKISNKDKIVDFASEIRTAEAGFLYNKIIDKNILLAILLHSDINIVKSIMNVFNKKGINDNIAIGKIINNIPSIFVLSLANDNCKYKIPTNYDKFMANVALLSEYKVDLRCMLKYPVFFVNDVNKNRGYIEQLKILNVNIKNILEHVGNIFTINPNIIFNNIELLKFHGIELTDDENNYGYSILGMKDLDSRIDYLIEKKMWKKSDGLKHDNIDLIRALCIRNDYLMWKNNFKCDKLSNVPFEEKPLNGEMMNYVYENYADIVTKLDESDYFVENNYVIGFEVISRHRILKNLGNYRGKGNAFEESLRYKNNANNIDEVVNVFFSSLGLGENKDEFGLSKGL